MAGPYMHRMTGQNAQAHVKLSWGCCCRFLYTAFRHSLGQERRIYRHIRASSRLAIGKFFKKKFDHPGREEELQKFEKMQPAQPPQPPRSNKVAVFYRSTQRLELRDKEEITANISEAVRRQKLSRAPWNRDKDISLPSDKSKHVDKEDCECCRFDARVHHYRLGHLFWLKRLVGSVTEIYVFDYPLPKRSSAQSSPELH
ncbi:hypothetical protein IWZ01DRAFT_52716 [Phyllosticta capitalensis]